MDATQVEAILRQQLANSPGSRAHIAFVSVITLAYRNLHEQSDTGAILTPEQFIELLIAGAKAIRLEARSTTLRALCPNPATLDKDVLSTDYLMATVKIISAENDALAKFAAIMKKTLDTKPTTGGTST